MLLKKFNFPFFERETTKCIILNILSQKYPLTKMQIYNEFKKYKSVTFHAVNKAVNSLYDLKVISKSGKKYSLSYEWLLGLKKFAEDSLSKLQDESGCLIHGVIDIKKEGDIVTLTFDSIFNMDIYCKSLHDHYYSKLKNDDIVCLVYTHHWWHILYPWEEYPFNENNKRFYCVCTSNTLLDRTSIQFKKSLGMNVIYRKDVPFKNTAVYGDVVIQTIISKDLAEKLDRFFKETKTIAQLTSQKFKSVLKKKGKVIVVINKNRELAEEIKKYVLSLFDRR